MVTDDCVKVYVLSADIALQITSDVKNVTHVAVFYLSGVAIGALMGARASQNLATFNILIL